MYHVLILDNDAQFGQRLAQSLEHSLDFPCRVITATNETTAYATVLQANTPFDIFLIDQRLGPGPDGIDVLQELLRLSPRTGSIVFTIANDLESGERAFQAGAFRYIHKPFKTRELVLILRSLLQWNQTRHERDRLRILTEIAEQAQYTVSLPQLGNLIVTGSCRLGFERALLWLVKDVGGQQQLQGLSAIGDHGDLPFTNIRFSVAETPYASAALIQRSPILFEGESLGPTYLHRIYGVKGFGGERGEWAMLPLWYRDMCLGLLSLDNYSGTRRIRPEQLEELTLLGQQVAGALYRVQLHEQEQRKSHEFEVLAEIGRLAASHAATVDLDTLLREVRTLVGRLMDVRNFILVLRDPIFGELDFRLHIEHDIEQERWFLKANAGLLGYVLQTGISLLLLTYESNAQFRHEHRIELKGESAICWLGVPLLIEGRIIGGMAVQSYEKAFAYDTEDERLLRAVADQVAGAIQTARLREEAIQNNQRLQVLQQVSSELLALAEQDVDWLWHATLTVATAGYGLGYNRAMLFLVAEGGTALVGKLGIGQNSLAHAHRDWEQDHDNHLDFSGYLNRLRTEGFDQTEVDLIVRTIRIVLPDDRSIFGQVLRTQRPALVPEEDALPVLPTAFTERFGKTEYAVVPAVVGRKTIGLVVVDYVHTRKPLQSTPLSTLETMLAQASLVYENRLQRHASDLLIEAQLEVLAQVANQPLQQTLDKICTATQGITGANSVLVYLFTSDSTEEQLQYDLMNTTYVGLHEPFHLHNRPGATGITRLVLREGPQVIHDIFDESLAHSTTLLKSSLMRREQIRAFIAVPVRDSDNNAPRGVLYLNYNTPQIFSEADTQRARSIAELIDAAIRTARVEEATRSGREAAELLSSMHGRELRVHSRVLSTALQPVTSTAIARELLIAASELLKRGNEQFGLMLREWQTPESPKDEPREVRRQYFLRADDSIEERQVIPELDHGITGRAFANKYDARVMDLPIETLHDHSEPRAFDSSTTHSELDVLIQLDQEILGLFNVESPEPGAFSDQEYQVLRRLATVGALALDNVRRQRNLRNILRAIETIVAPTGLHATLEAVLEAASRVAPGVSAVMIWYKEPESGRIVSGPQFGVREEYYLHEDQSQLSKVLARVMLEHDPIYVSDVRDEPWSAQRFVREEQFVSVAALPLWISDGLRDDESAIGAMFFSYRKPHEFTFEERTLFPILAAFVATSVRDESRLEQVRKERARLTAALDITNAVGTELSLDKILERIMDTLHILLPNAWLAVLMYRERTQSLEFASASMKYYPIDYPDRVISLDINNDRSIACWTAREALRRREVYLENNGDTWNDSDYLETISGTRSELCLSLLNTNKQLLGVLVLESDRPNAFSEEDAAIVKGIGPAISTAIDRAHRIAELQFSSSIATATFWAAELAHDINREIGNIRKRVALLERKVDPLHRDTLSQIDRSAKLLVTYARAAQEAEVVPIDQWMQETLEGMGILRNLNIQWQFVSGGEHLVALISPILLERILGHLIRNAVEAGGKDVHLTFSSQQRESEMIEIHVSNTGPSIDDRIRQHLFVEQVSTKPSDHQGGRGLLFVRWAVQTMGGTIDLISKPGQDVTFAFTLPLVNSRGREKEDEQRYLAG